MLVDIKQKLLIYKNKTYNIDYERYRGKHNLFGLDEHLSSIAHRVFYDYTVNGFLCNDNIYTYGTDIHLRPEFLLTLTKAFPELQALEEEWVNNTCSYRIDYFAYTNQLQRFNFSLDDYSDPPCKEWFYLRPHISGYVKIGKTVAPKDQFVRLHYGKARVFVKACDEKETELFAKIADNSNKQ